MARSARFRPTGIAVDSEGNVWVADTGNGRVQAFTPGGEYLTKFGSFADVADVAADPEGGLRALDRQWDTLQKWSFSWGP